MAEVGDERPRANTLMVVKLGFTYKYTIPNFSVITVELRHAKVKKPGNDYFFDTFFKDNITLELIPPVCVQVTESCFTKAKEFVAQLQLPGIQLEDDNIQIVWNCTVIGDNECDDDDAIEDKEETTSNSDTNSLSSNQREENIQEDSTVPHTIVFKCIGAVRDVGSQRALRTARDNIHNGWTVPVRMIPEPTNIVDSRAIVFECKLKGYVVTDILDEVHSALSQILNVEFKWVKYITHWTRSGPGYYAGISVTKRGPWDRRVKQFQSTILS